MKESISVPRQNTIVIGQFSYVEDSGCEFFYNGQRVAMHDYPSDFFLEVVPRAFYDALLNQLQNLEQIHEFKDELLRLSYVDHPDVDQLLFHGATTAPSEEMALYMMHLLASRMVTTGYQGSHHEIQRLSLLYRLSQERHKYEEVGIQVTARMLAMFARVPPRQ